MSGYEALAAKVRAMYGKRLKMEDFEHISTLHSEREVLEYLRNHPGWKRALGRVPDMEIHRAQLETLLQNEVRQEYVALNHYVPRKDKFALSFPVMLCELDQILAVFRRLVAKGRVKPKVRFEVELPPDFLLHSKLDYSALRKCTDYAGLTAAAKGTIYGAPLSLFQPTEQTPLPDYTATEVLLRSTYYSTLYRRAARNYAGETRRVLLRSLGQQVDLLNITHILRLKKYFPGDTRYLSSLFPINDRLKPDLIRALLEAPDVEGVFELLAPSPYASVFAERDVPSLEAYSVRTFARFNHRQLTSGVPSVYTAIAYLNLKDLAMKALVNDIECVKYGVPFDPFLARLATGEP
ncbi:MAG: V-type ATPase subunit [Oscillospiraceae bacterium]|nr:V-type ATPase subunit [Oscillospiraceae bacterium]